MQNSGLLWLAAKTGEENVYCLDIHLDLRKGGREHKWRGTVVNFGIKTDSGWNEDEKMFEGGGYVRSWSKIICLESLKAAPDFLAGGHSFSTYTKFSEKPHSYSLIRTRTCGDQVVRNISFSENFAYVLNEWHLV